MKGGLPSEVQHLQERRWWVGGLHVAIRLSGDQLYKHAAVIVGQHSALYGREQALTGNERLDCDCGIAVVDESASTDLPQGSGEVRRDGRRRLAAKCYRIPKRLSESVELARTEQLDAPLSDRSKGRWIGTYSGNLHL